MTIGIEFYAGTVGGPSKVFILTPRPSRLPEILTVSYVVQHR